ncbi:MAG: GTP-binding protein [Pseudomonadota bacterium]
MEQKIIFAGQVGSGKTTAISAISDITVVATEANASDDVKERKATTTVAMDYGVLDLGEGGRVHLYGTPGQARFDYMWDILTVGGLGLVLLVDNAAEKPLEDMKFYLKAFDKFLKKRPVCIGVTRMDLEPIPRLNEYHKCLKEAGVKAPVFEVDARDSNDVKTLIASLVQLITVRL